MRLDKIQSIPHINKFKLLGLTSMLLAQLFISGCWNQIEVSSTVEAAGLACDLQNNQPSVSVQLAQPVSRGESGGEPSKPINITQTGQTYTEAARKTMLSLPRLPVWSHAGVIIIGEDLAQQDVSWVADFIARNRNFRKTSSLFITSGTTARECLEAELPVESFSIAGLKKLIRIQEQQLGYYSEVATDKFLEELATPGIQPVVPQVTIIEVDNKKVLRLDGTAVFKDRKVVGSLNEVESQGYRFLSPRMINGGFLVVNYPPDGEASPTNRLIGFELTRSLAAVKPVFEGNKVRMQIHIEAEGNFYEQTFIGDVLTLNNVKKIEALIDERIKEEVNAAIMKAQGLNSDIFGWGRMIRKQNPKVWQELETDWDAVFPGIETDITVHFAMRRSYLLDRSFEFKE